MLGYIPATKNSEVSIFTHAPPHLPPLQASTEQSQQGCGLGRGVCPREGEWPEKSPSGQIESPGGPHSAPGFKDPHYICIYLT